MNSMRDRIFGYFFTNFSEVFWIKIILVSTQYYLLNECIIRAGDLGHRKKGSNDTTIETILLSSQFKKYQQFY